MKLGILPAMISPYVLAKIGASAARELFLTGMRFDAARAKEIGLVHAVVPADQLDRRVADYVKEILSAGPEAIATAKELLKKVGGAARAGHHRPDGRYHRGAPRVCRGAGGDARVPGKAQGAWNVLPDPIVECFRIPIVECLPGS